MEFQHGPFLFEVIETFNLGGTKTYRWRMSYGSRETLGERALPASYTRETVAEEFGDARAEFIQRHRPCAAPRQTSEAPVARLIRSSDTVGVGDGALDHFVVRAPVPGVTSGLIDDRYPTWIMIDGKACAPMGREEFERLKAAHEAIPEPAGEPAAPELAWVVELLPEGILTADPEQWRAPTNWEIRHIVGEGSFSGLPGAKAAALVGISANNFRKYTASDGAKNRQAISYSAWHLLLHRLGVQALGSDDEN